MIHPHLQLLRLLRDAVGAALVVTLGALCVDGRVGFEVGVGSFAGVANVALWLAAANSLRQGGAGQALLPLKLFAAVGMVWVLTRFLPGTAAFIGFSSALVGLAARSLVGGLFPARVA
ncbi:MAG: hypothetical protein EXR71_03390 [Myxococcales bacterium]|nr:hypothetical protein [Myxococcales bacterium]